MLSICIYFQVHQPFRLKNDYSFFDIGTGRSYEDDDINREICNRVSRKCYIPANELMLELIDRHEGRFKISFSISGIALEQFEKYNPEVIDLFKRLAETGCVEFINETYYHSLACLYSKAEFKSQVLKHRNKIEYLFNQTPVVFRNTELVYNNDLAKSIEDMGYKVILAEGADFILDQKSPNFLYKPSTCNDLNLLLKNYRLSDDIAFRFSDSCWLGYPLTAEKFAHWIHRINGNGDVVNLFMDYETFGEHHWEETGIFNFLRALPDELLEHPDVQFIIPSQSIDFHTPVCKLEVPHFISWADNERDLSAWTGNSLQRSAIEMVYDLEDDVMLYGSSEMIDVWRRLLCSDHFYYMCTKWSSDGDVHKYFNPYETPFDAYIVYVNILNDLRNSLSETELYHAKEDKIYG